MGLDVYLYRYENKDADIALEESVEKATEGIWDKEIAALGKSKYEELTDAEKDSISSKIDALKESMGMVINPAYTWKSYKVPGESKIEEPSKLHPDHLFKLGYFRSSYNGAGIDSVMGNAIGETLYSLIPASDNPESMFQPDWDAARGRVVSAIDRMKVMDKDCPVRVSEVRTMGFGRNKLPSSAKEALNIFKNEMASHKGLKGKSMCNSYSDINGEFYLDKRHPLKVMAMIPGERVGFMPGPTVYVVTKDDYKFYIEALEIVLETIDYVLAKPDKDKY